MDPAVHRTRPLEKAPEVVALTPHEFPEFQEADLRHLHAGVGFDAPQQVGAAPGGQTMAFGGVPQEAETVAHAVHHTCKVGRSLDQRIMNHKGQEGSRRKTGAATSECPTQAKGRLEWATFTFSGANRRRRNPMLES